MRGGPQPCRWAATNGAAQTFAPLIIEAAPELDAWLEVCPLLP
ncbi:hypothetical protein [Streptomyces sp. WAC 06725]|nr:hypothetical protein [Streptomyces sp. WAC 06725]